MHIDIFHYVNLIIFAPFMTQQASNQRFLPLDILRGITVALMTVVNNPGNWAHVYAPLRHSAWDGCTPTDLVFPTFLFCVGCAMAFSLSKYNGFSKASLWRIFRRGAGIFLLGWFLNAYPFNHMGAVRTFGVLQRIACCYVFASILVLWLKSTKKLAVCGLVLLAIYTLALVLFGEDGAQFTLEGNVTRRIDTALLGEKHLYGGYGIPFDPEGVLGTLSSTATVILGYLAGLWVKNKGDKTASEKTATILFAGLASLAAGMILSIWVPINKPLWSASYVFYAGGWALEALGVIMYFTEMKGCKKAFTPALVFGTNAIVAYFLSAFLARVLGQLDLIPDGLFTTEFLSLVYALCFMSLIWLIDLILYKKKIYVKL